MDWQLPFKARVNLKAREMRDYLKDLIIERVRHFVSLCFKMIMLSTSIVQLTSDTYCLVVIYTSLCRSCFVCVCAFLQMVIGKNEM